ncbi:hypothetical protein ACQ4M4_17530 [Leptolyngbya sp. AN02str]|uniref:hypothetical protein n=1 Tax=Leptolyngbya sp. AN02str TaxID=3423363 RepID=UPI003D3160C7
MMPKYKTVGDLFEKTPRQWGLRGDPHLWSAMRDRFANTPIPAIASDLETLIEQAFEELTGKPISTPDLFYDERFAHGGMSSGCISPPFWRDTAIPMLKARLTEET